MKLLLFDIDGTILHAHGAGRRLVDEIFLELTGRSTSERLTYSGKTDPQIAREMADSVGLTGAERDEVAQRALEIYTERILEALPRQQVTLLGGVSELIDQMHQNANVQLGLLTGNVEVVAYAKLRAVGLSEYFEFGAFGSDSEDRYSLPPIAQERAIRHTGRSFERDNVVIIGDTEHDICCGRAIGAFSVAVCTGHYDRDELEKHSPHAIFETLENVAEFDRIVVQRAA